MAESLKTVHVETIIADAEVAAIYLRSLIAKEIPMQHAVALTSSYISGRLLSRVATQEPKNPWENQDEDSGR